MDDGGIGTGDCAGSTLTNNEVIIASGTTSFAVNLTASDPYALACTGKVLV